MLDIIISQPATVLPLPAPRVPISIRPAVMSDLAFVDSLQKMHTKAVGWMPTNQLEGCIKQDRILIAEQSPTNPIGYLVGADRYFKRDDVGIIYQMNVLPDRQRGLVAASLLKAQFERSAYGCKLYCCWCAQDLAANKFWEAMGFVPLAFRTGGPAMVSPAKRGCTSSGRSGFARVMRPRRGGSERNIRRSGEGKSSSVADSAGDALERCEADSVAGDGDGWRDHQAIADARQPRVKRLKIEPIKQSVIASGGLRFAAAPVAPVAGAVVRKVKPEPKVRQKNDPRLVAAARELKDRWLEQLNATPLIGHGKYDVSRRITTTQAAKQPLVLIEQAIAA